MKTTIYHNPACSKSRATLSLLQAAAIEPDIILYLQTPPSVEKLTSLIAAMQIAPRDLMRQSGELFDQLGLADPSLADAQLVAAMVEHPSLMNRPIVETDNGVRLCRPPELVHDIL